MLALLSLSWDARAPSVALQNQQSHLAGRMAHSVIRSISFSARKRLWPNA